MAPRAHDDEYRLPPNFPRPGRIGTLVDQAAVRLDGIDWYAEDGDAGQASIRYAFVGGREHGRALDGSVRTFLFPVGDVWPAAEALSARHLGECLPVDPDRGPQNPSPRWEQMVVMADGERRAARQSIVDGYEAIVFRLGDRVVSSVFSLYDASDIDCSFACLTWPPPTAAPAPPAAGPGG